MARTLKFRPGDEALYHSGTDAAIKPILVKVLAVSRDEVTVATEGGAEIVTRPVNLWGRRRPRHFRP